MKKIIFCSLLSLALLSSCGGEVSTTNQSQESVSETTTNSDSKDSESLEIEQDSPFLKLDSEEAFSLYHESFMLELYYDKEGGYNLFLTDYSLGDDVRGYGCTLSSDTFSLSFKGVEKSLLFPLEKSEVYTLTYQKENSSFSLTGKDILYTLSTKEVERKYYFNPSLVGLWDIKEKEEDDLLFFADIQMVSYQPIIKIQEGDVCFTTTLTHSEKGSTATLVGEKDGTTLKVGDEILFTVDESNQKKAVVNNHTYSLFVHIDDSYEYEEGYFSLSNLPNNTYFTYQDLKLTLKTPIGAIRRWVKIEEGDFSKEELFECEQNQGILSYHCQIEGKEGIIKEGVTYKLAAIKEDSSVSVHLLGSDGSNLLMEEHK